MIAAHRDGEAFGGAAGGHSDLDGGPVRLGYDARLDAENLLRRQQIKRGLQQVGVPGLSLDVLRDAVFVIDHVGVAFRIHVQPVDLSEISSDSSSGITNFSSIRDW